MKIPTKRYDYEDVFRALLLGVEEAVARTRKNWKAASTDMAQYREEKFAGLVQTYLGRIIWLWRNGPAHWRWILPVLAHPQRNRLCGGGEHLHERAAADRLLVPEVLGRDAQLGPDPAHLVDLAQRASQELFLLQMWQGQQVCGLHMHVESVASWKCFLWITHTPSLHS